MESVARFTLTIIFFIAVGSCLSQSNSFISPYDRIAEWETPQWKTQNQQTHPLTESYDIKYYRLEISARPDSHYISGSVTCYYLAKEEITEIYFELNSLLTVDSIQHESTAINFSHRENLINVDHTTSKNTLDSLTIFYHGSPPDGTSFRTETHNNQPILWTLSEPYGAIDWWPCKQSLTDKADSVDVFITTPKEYQVAGNGLLTSTTNNGNYSTSHWKNRYPIVAYLVAMAITPYSEISFHTTLKKGDLFVQNYVYKEDSANFRDQLFTTDTLLRFYDSLIGDYPFMNEKYGHAQFGRGGGMEHQTMSFMTHFGFGLNAHELAHQWFGNKITCGSWTDIWLNEGFATYFTGVPLETMYQGEYWEEWKETTLERATRNSQQSIYVEDTSSVSRIFDPDLSYAKAGYMLHMLRKQIGDSVFWEGIRNYLKDPNLAYKTALTNDFFSHIETAADTNLNLFKEQWIYGIGYPSFNLEWEQINEQFSVKMIQTTSNQTTPLFNLNVPVLIIGETDSLWLHLNQIENELDISINIPFQVQNVIIDPKKDLISKSNFVHNKSSFTDLVLYPNPTSYTLNIIPNSDVQSINAYYIYDSKGSLVYSLKGQRLTQSFTIDVSQFSQGNYKIKFESGREERVESFVITR